MAARKSAAPAVRREPLNKARIAQAGLDFIDEHGLDALSTRRLGAQLGVEAMALYRHFPSKEALLDAVAELLVLQIPVPSSGAGGWQARVKEFARAYRGLSRSHPRAYPLLATRRFNTPRTLQLLDTLFSELLGAGFSPAASVELFRAVGNYSHGTALDELAGVGQSEAPSSGAATGKVVSGLPALAKVAPYLTDTYFDQVFEAGLEVIVEGFARRQARGAGP
jgi:AcrR family transcriptional regulator